MAKGYMFYDDETANSEQRICSLAYILYDNEGNQISNPVSQLINPECRIEYWNHKKHGICNDDVVNMPTIRQFCENSNFLSHLTEYVLVAHNAKGADLHHIKKSLTAYTIDVPDIEYIDTMAFASNNIAIGALKDICNFYHIVLDNHHDALADALACQAIFERLCAEYGKPDSTLWGKETVSSSSGRGRRRPTGCLGFVNGSDQAIEEVLHQLKGEGLRGDPNSVTAVKDLHVNVTGSVPGYNRSAIKDILITAGAQVSSGVNGKTQLVVIGDNAGKAKIDGAIQRRIPVISTFELLDILNSL